MIFFISTVFPSNSSFLLLRIESYLKLLVWACYFLFQKSSSSLLTQSTGRMVTRIVATLLNGSEAPSRVGAHLKGMAAGSNELQARQPLNTHLPLSTQHGFITIGVKRSWHAECSPEKGGGGLILISARHVLSTVQAVTEMHREMQDRPAVSGSMQMNRRVKCTHTHTHIHTLHLMVSHPIWSKQNALSPHNLMRLVLSLSPLHSYGKWGKELGW